MNLLWWNLQERSSLQSHTFQSSFRGAFAKDDHWTGKAECSCSMLQFTDISVTLLAPWVRLSLSGGRKKKGSRVRMPVFTSSSWPLMDVRSQRHFLSTHDLQGGDNNYSYFLGFHVIVHIKYFGWFIQNRCKLFLFILLWQLFYMLYESDLILFIMRLFIMSSSVIHNL